MIPRHRRVPSYLLAVPAVALLGLPDWAPLELTGHDAECVPDAGLAREIEALSAAAAQAKPIPSAPFTPEELAQGIPCWPLQTHLLSQVRPAPCTRSKHCRQDEYESWPPFGPCLRNHGSHCTGMTWLDTVECSDRDREGLVHRKDKLDVGVCPHREQQRERS